jgi:protein-tyrosine-phosphatase
LLEVNPRFWGSLPLAVAAGADFPALWWDLAAHGREGAGTYASGVVKADLTGEFDRVVDRFEAASGLARLRAAAMGMATALSVLMARRSADSWAADDPRPWSEERLELARRLRDALRKRLPGRGRRHRTRFEDFAQNIAQRARGRALRLIVVGRDNVCRSAFGERLLRLRLAGLPVSVASAGHVPRRGAFPALATVNAAAEFGVDLSGHSSNALSPADLEQADALILMDAESEWRLRQMCPDFTAEVMILAEPDGAGTDSFPAIAAALERLASVVERSFHPRPQLPAVGEVPPARRQAA